MPRPRFALTVRPVLVEAIGTAFLLIAVVGSGIMGQQLSPDNIVTKISF